MQVQHCLLFCPILMDLDVVEAYLNPFPESLADFYHDLVNSDMAQ